MKPADAADTQKILLPADDDAPIELDEADLQEIAAIRSRKETRSNRICTECARSVFVIAGGPPPKVEDLITSTIFWSPKDADGRSKSCTVSGDSSAPVWWFCPYSGMFVVRGVFRVKIERL